MNYFYIIGGAVAPLLIGGLTDAFSTQGALLIPSYAMDTSFSLH